jgi:pilus assembly protein Flp/PilA
MSDSQSSLGNRGTGRELKLGVVQGDYIMMFIRKLIKNSKGATAIEYGLIAALIAVAAISAMSTLGTKISTTFNNVSSNLK